MSIWDVVKAHKDLATHPGLGDSDWPPSDFDGDGKDDIVYLGSKGRDKLFGPLEWKEEGGRLVITNNWKSDNIIKVHVPQLVDLPCYGNRFSGDVWFHKLAAPQLLGFFQEVEDEGLLHLVLEWGGSFVFRLIRGSKTTLSNHAYGVAFDINMKQNGLKATPALVGEEGEVRRLVPLAEKWGFYWGGRYRRKDGMHFECVKVL